jgi:hypothetical protein
MWANHLPKEEREAFNKKVLQAKTVLDRLSTLMEADYNASDKEMHKRENFFMPAWAEKQAFELGIQKTLKKHLKLTKV